MAIKLTIFPHSSVNVPASKSLTTITIIHHQISNDFEKMIESQRNNGY